MSQQTPDVVSHEEVDAVVVGSRIAGSATAIALARRGVRVIALDRAKFPSDTVSTHVLFATGVAELKWLGALERVKHPQGPERLIEGWGPGGRCASGRRGEATSYEGDDGGMSRASDTSGAGPGSSCTRGFAEPAPSDREVAAQAVAA